MCRPYPGTVVPNNLPQKFIVPPYFKPAVDELFALLAAFGQFDIVRTLHSTHSLRSARYARRAWIVIGPVAPL